MSAQQFSIGTRCIKVLIEGETLILSSIIPRVTNAQEDFDSLATSTLDANQATILLFCLSDQAIEKQNWLLLSFIPDGCKVREKMLYSSSREDLKRAMGLGFFSQDYSANTLPEIKWVHLKAYMSNDHRKEEYLSEKEKMIREEQVSSSRILHYFLLHRSYRSDYSFADIQIILLRFSLMRRACLRRAQPWAFFLFQQQKS